MIMELPRPQSVWKQRVTNRTMRVICSDPHDVVAHDAECSDSRSIIVSWRGSAKDFFDNFIPADPKLYPKSAS